MSSLLDLNATVDLLDRLKLTVTELAAKEDSIVQADQAQRALVVRSSEFATKQRAAELSERLVVAQSDFAVARSQAKARYDRRETRISQAHKSLLKSALQGVAQGEDRHKYLYQKRMLDTERLRQTEVDQAAATREKLHHEVTSSQDRFAALEYSAQDVFSFSVEFRRLLGMAAPEAGDIARDESQILHDLDVLSTETEGALRAFRRDLLVGVFRAVPVWLMVGAALLAYVGAVWALPFYGMRTLPFKDATIALACVLAAITLFYQLGKHLARPRARLISGNLAKAREWHVLCLQKADQRHREAETRIRAVWETTTQKLQADWEQALAEVERQRAARPGLLEEKMRRVREWNFRRHSQALEQIDREHRRALERLQSESDAQAAAKAEVARTTQKQLDDTLRSNRQQLEEEWQARIQPMWESIQTAEAYSKRVFPDWSQPGIGMSILGRGFDHATRLGQIHVDVEALSGVSFQDRRLRFPGPARFSVPLLLRFPEQGSLLLETGECGREEAAAALNALVFQLLALVPPGKAAFTLIDPVGLGQTFAGLMHLSDYEEGPIQGRVWTQGSQIEEQLAELNEHMEKVIQMYLRNEYPTIAEYNEQAGAVAEKYHFLVIAGFPTNFSETAGRRLLNIIASGARCGVYTFIQWDRRVEAPHGFLADELRKKSVRLCASQRGFVVPDRALPGTRVSLEKPPQPECAVEFLHRVGESTKDSQRVELPFAQVAPLEAERWKENSAEEVRVPIGRSGATKLQYLALGRGTRQHALIAGKTGSGKSTLFHVIITNTALWYGPDQVEFYLVDFKKGVEFKVYANRRLPHAKVVAIESDREFGLSVLQRIDEELRRRGDLFRGADVQDLAGFRKARPGTPLPRLLLLIDEFQEFFTEEDRISQAAAVLLDRIVRQGRAFGVHVILGSQTLGGAYTLARATIGQMVVRIALQCNEADAYLIMDESNAAPRLLSRPGEGLYNDMAGALEANSPFQTAWLSDDVRDQALSAVRELADRGPAKSAGPLVFEGNAPADLRENLPLQLALRTTPSKLPSGPRVWLGAPNSIKGPTEVHFQQQSGANLLVVGQGEDAALGIPAMALISLAAQFPAGMLRLILLDGAPPGSPERTFLDRVLKAIPHPVSRPKRSEIPELVNELAQAVSQRESGADSLTTFLVISGLQDFKALRQEDEFSFSAEAGSAPNAAASLVTLITEGPSRGCHVIATVDTQANVSRFLGRKAQAEFHHRVLFQMSASDSASLIDNPDGAKLGLHRALLYNEREGYLEKFRPYALSGRDWLEEIGEILAQSSQALASSPP